MADDNQHLNMIVKLLWSGDTAEAKRLIAIESDLLEAQVSDLKGSLSKVEANLATLRTLMPASGGQMSLDEAGADTKQGAASQGLTLAQKRLRENEILKAADEILQNKEEFTSGEVAEILLESGVVIGVPENRITTAIAGVLKRYKDKYERIDRGVYIGVKRDQPSQNGHGGVVQAEGASLE